MSDGTDAVRGTVEGVGDSGRSNVTVELWQAGYPQALRSTDEPYANAGSVPGADEEALDEAHLATVVTDPDGEFRYVLLSDEAVRAGAEILVRVFDGETFLGASTVEATASAAIESVSGDDDGDSAGSERESDSTDTEAETGPETLVIRATDVDVSTDTGWRTLASLRGLAALGVAGVAVGGAALLVLTREDSPLPDPGELTETATPGGQGETTTALTPDEPDWQPQITPPSEPTEPLAQVSQQARFLYTGSDPIQTGVSPDAIDETEASVLRGRVLDQSGEPVPGATVTINGHPEYGRTETRETGLFDMAVNGGETLTVNVEAAEFLPVQRKLTPRPSNYGTVPEIALIRPDDSPSTVTMDADETQIARGTPSDDAAGQRRPTLVFRPGTSAVLPDGSRPDELTVRITEYTVGQNGPEAMPRRLPAETAYTFALEFSVDEAMPTTDTEGRTGTTDGALERAFVGREQGSVTFSQPVVQYVENFLDFPVGEAVPTGAVDRSDASWGPIDDGRVVEVVDVSNGRASLDVDGTGSAASDTQRSDLNITTGERDAIGGIYEAGTQLWRVPIPHFTPFDCNWPRDLPDDADPPPVPREWFEQEGERCQAPSAGVGGSVDSAADLGGDER